MKFAQLARDTTYESKNGQVVRKIIRIHDDGVVEYQNIVKGQREQRVHEMKGQDFATWAHRKVGTTLHRSQGDEKFLTLISGPKG